VAGNSDRRGTLEISDPYGFPFPLNDLFCDLFVCHFIERSEPTAISRSSVPAVDR
jgi:hypothetical protein